VPLSLKRFSEVSRDSLKIARTANRVLLVVFVDTSSSVYSAMNIL
jgi:hypothetical protein